MTSQAVEAPAATPSVTGAHSRSFTARDVPWMKLGAVLEGGAVSAEEAARRGGLDFEVELRRAGAYYGTDSSGGGSSPLTDAERRELAALRTEVETASSTEALRKFGRRVPQLLDVLARLDAARGDDEWRTIESRRAAVRKDDGTFFAYVSSDYKPVQYAEAFAFMDSVNPSYVAAGTLGHGRQGFMVVQLPDRAHLDLRINGVADPHDMYGILRTSHDLSRGIEVAVIGLRGKCMNQVALPSLTYGAKQRWSIRHVGDPRAKLTAATESMARFDAYVEEFERVARRLAEVNLELDEFENLLKTVLPDRPRRDEQISSILTNWTADPNGTVGVAQLGHNGWTATQAVNEYFEWGRESGVRTAQSRFTSGLNGPTHKFTGRTAQLLLRRA